MPLPTGLPPQLTGGRMPEPELVPVFLTNATRTSSGNGPGVVHVPPAEAAALVADRRAVYGEQAPRGYGDRLDTGLR
jgi:hypothetical protein